MKQILTIFSLSLALGAVALAQGPVNVPVASVSAHPPTKVAVIQIQSALVSTHDGQKAVADFQSSLQPKKAALDKKASEIRDLQDKLQRGGAAMADAAKAELQRTIEVKTKDYNRDVEDATADANDAQRKMLDVLGQKMMKVIDQYAQTNGYAVILDVSNPNTPVLYASNTVDITRQIIELYDKMNPGPAQTSTTKPAAAPAARPSTASAVKK